MAAWVPKWITGPGRTGRGRRNSGPPVTRVWYSPFSPQISAPGGRDGGQGWPRPASGPRKETSRQSSRTSLITARKPASTPSRPGAARPSCHKGSRQESPAAAQRSSSHWRCSGMSMSPNAQASAPRALARPRGVFKSGVVLFGRAGTGQQGQGHGRGRFLQNGKGDTVEPGALLLRIIGGQQRDRLMPLAFQPPEGQGAVLAAAVGHHEMHTVAPSPFYAVSSRRPYLRLSRSSFSIMAGPRMARNRTVAAACTRSKGRPEAYTASSPAQLRAVLPEHQQGAEIDDRAVENQGGQPAIDTQSHPPTGQGSGPEQHPGQKADEAEAEHLPRGPGALAKEEVGQESAHGPGQQPALRPQADPGHNHQGRYRLDLGDPVEGGPSGHRQGPPGWR